MEESVYTREPPKKRTKTSKANDSAIVPCVDEPPTRMSFPPSQTVETTTMKEGKDVNTSAGSSKSKKRKKDNSGSGGAKRSKTGSNQPEPIPIELDMPSKKADVPVKVTKKKKKESVDKLTKVPLDSPAMGTRSKKFNPASPAMSTRSKRRLSL